MTAIADFTAVIAAWLNREDYSEALITTWVRMGEERLNLELRIKDQIQIDTATITQRRVLLPTDWLQVDYLRPLYTSGMFRYTPRDDFYSRTDAQSVGYYTITGNYIQFGGEPDATEGKSVEMAYYGNVPTLGNETTWLLSLYPSLITWATLINGEAYGINSEQALTWEGAIAAKIKTLNDAHLISKASGSRLTRPSQRGFG